MLDVEIDFFEKNRAQWLKQHPGNWVLVKGSDLLGVFPTQEEALSEGARLVGLQSFLVRPLVETEEDVYIPALALGLLRANTEHPV